MGSVRGWKAVRGLETDLRAGEGLKLNEKLKVVSCEWRGEECRCCDSGKLLETRCRVALKVTGRKGLGLWMEDCEEVGMQVEWKVEVCRLFEC